MTSQTCAYRNQEDETGAASMTESFLGYRKTQVPGPDMRSEQRHKNPRSELVLVIEFPDGHEYYQRGGHGK